MAFIKLDRELFDSPLWLSEPFTKAQAWVDLIAMANYADKTKYYKGDFQKIKRGQIVTSQRTLAERWKWSKSKVATYIRALERAEMVSTDNTNRWTVLTIVNYAFYQDSKTTKRPQIGPREDHEEATERPRKGLQEEYKEYKNQRRESASDDATVSPSLEEVRLYQMETGLSVDPDAFFDYYEGQGWTRGGQPIKNWKAVFRGWKDKEVYGKKKPEVSDAVRRWLEE